MSAYFFDSSALVKRYVAEIGTTWVRSLVTPTAGNITLVAHITSVEIVSGAMRRKRDGSISPRIAHAVRLLVDRHTRREYTIVALTEPVSQRAENLLEVYPLRAYDAVQLASALESNIRVVAAGLPPLIFVSADQRLLSAANAEGLATDDPNAHP
jgi:predicted nucleic acid-binding protein